MSLKRNDPERICVGGIFYTCDPGDPDGVRIGESQRNLFGLVTQDALNEPGIGGGQVTAPLPQGRIKRNRRRRERTVQRGRDPRHKHHSCCKNNIPECHTDVRCCCHPHPHFPPPGGLRTPNAGLLFSLLCCCPPIRSLTSCCLNSNPPSRLIIPMHGTRTDILTNQPSNIRSSNGIIPPH